MDSQLDARIDDLQKSYFREARKVLGDADIILCTATPAWLEAADREPGGTPGHTPFDNLLEFIGHVLDPPDRDRIRLLLTGDKHHYAHYTPDTGAELRPELVTCGGGGAFLSSTHHLPATLNPFWPPGSATNDDAGYTLAKEYPTKAQSRALVAPPRFLTAGWRNGVTLPLLAGIVDTAVASVMLHYGLWPSLGAAAALAIAFGFYARFGKNDRAPRVWAGALLAIGHTAGHVGAAGLAVWLFTRLLPLGPWWSLPAAFGLLFILGTVVFVTYLHIADRFGWHTLEAFSGMRFEEYKCHLRMHVREMSIRVSVVGMDGVPANRGKATLTLPEPRFIDRFEISHRASLAQVAKPGG